MDKSPGYVQWNLPEGAAARLGKGHVNDIAFSPDGKTMAAASGAGVWLYDAKTGAETALLGVPGEIAHAASFSPNGKILAVCGSYAAGGGVLRLWDMRTMDVQSSMEMSDNSVCVDFSPDGKTVVTGGGDDVHLWDVRFGALIAALKGHKNLVRSVAFSPDGRIAAQRRLRRHDTALGRRDGRSAQDAQGAFRGCQLRSLFAGRQGACQRKRRQDDTDLGCPIERMQGGIERT